MSKKLVISIVVFIIIVLVIAFCCIKFVNSNNENNIDDFIDIDLVEQSHKQLNLDKDFTFAGFQKYREGGSYRYYYYFDKNTTVEIVSDNNNVSQLKVSISCDKNDLFDRSEYLNCVDKLLAKDFFSFSKSEKEDVRTFVLDNNALETIGGVYITTYVRDYTFNVIFTKVR